MTSSEAVKKEDEHLDETSAPPRPILALWVVVTGLVISALVAFVAARSASLSSLLMSGRAAVWHACCHRWLSRV